MSAAELLRVLAAVVLVTAGQTTLRAGMKAVGPITMERLRRPGALIAAVAGRWQVWLGFALYATSAAAWVYALSSVPLSLAYPFLGLTYVGVAGIATVALHERLTITQWIGIATVVAGVILVALTGK